MSLEKQREMNLSESCLRSCALSKSCAVSYFSLKRVSDKGEEVGGGNAVDTVMVIIKSLRNDSNF